MNVSLHAMNVLLGANEITLLFAVFAKVVVLMLARIVMDELNHNDK